MIDQIDIPTEPSAFDLAAAILALVADPVASKQRLVELTAASKEARAAIDEAAAGKEELAKARAEHQRGLDVDREEQLRAINKARNQASLEWEQREKALRGKESRAAELLAKAERDSSAAAKLKADYGDRMQKLHALAS